ncbi:RING/U-box [Glarea lozoyensis ATCC 20868]|uniref:RING/U-box n=1 Tax=Glarea lozoyensis (strain ATCC 20868 / MF5171) TaxID=1116229 RepID=S3CYE3_GLAL2|nr:RING/U-box [Glarea lozoyensis ATCC 20868]EPE29979.1 RING/U-box [Glarea lozoyensis ATCC 20868]
MSDPIEEQISSSISSASELLPISSDASNVKTESGCPICYEAYSQYRVKVPLEICKHNICQICYRFLLATPASDDNTAKCPLCRESVGEPLATSSKTDDHAEWRPQLVAQYKTAQDFFSDYRFPHVSNSEENLVGFSSSGWNVLESGHSCDISQYTGWLTEVTKVNRLCSKRGMRNIPDGISPTCKQADFESLSKNLRDVVDEMIGNYLSGSETSVMVLEPDIHLCSAPIRRNITEQPRWIHTFIKQSIVVRSESTEEFRQVDSVTWTLKMTQHCQWDPPEEEASIPASLSDWREKFLVDIRTQIYIALPNPHIQNSEQLKDFLISSGFNLYGTTLGQSPREDYARAALSKYPRSAGVLLSLADKYDSVLALPRGLRQRFTQDTWCSPLYRSLKNMERLTF